MKRITLAITFCYFTAAICHSQTTEDLLIKTIKLKSEKGTIQSFIDEISKSSDVVFSYEPPEIPLQKEVRLSKKEMKLEEILNELFKTTSIDFIIHSRVIILKKNPSKKRIEGNKGKGVISGIIKDSISGESLVGAIVYIDNLKLGEIANSYGFYSITVPAGKYKIQISSVGYNAQTIDTFLTGAIRLDFTLTPSIRELEEVVISYKQSRINDFQQSISRIDMQDVKELPSLFGLPDMLRNIQLLPGVNTTSEIGGNFQVRGGSWTKPDDDR